MQDNKTVDIQSICLAVFSLACIILAGVIALKGGPTNTTGATIAGSLITVAAGAIGAVAGSMVPKQQVQQPTQDAVSAPIVASAQFGEPLKWGTPPTTGEPTQRMSTPVYPVNWPHLDDHGEPIHAPPSASPDATFTGTPQGTTGAMPQYTS